MDMLYAKYSNPMDLINNYINRGRFGEFVNSFLEAEYERKKEQAEKDDDLRLWIMYAHTADKESFADWKKRVLGNSNNGRKPNGDDNLTDNGIKAIYDDLFPA